MPPNHYLTGTLIVRYAEGNACYPDNTNFPLAISS
jgi:hypothetical protein